MHNQVTLILVDSGSSTSFVSTAFVNQLGLSSQYSKPVHVKVASGEDLVSNSFIPQLEWWT